MKSGVFVRQAFSRSSRLRCCFSELMCRDFGRLLQRWRPAVAHCSEDLLSRDGDGMQSALMVSCRTFATISLQRLSGS